MMYQHQHVPAPIKQLVGIPQPLVALLEVILAKEPARRFQSPAELLKVLPVVSDAIQAGSLLAKTIRVFLSTTGDVQKERILADRVIRSIAAEFNVLVSATFSTVQRLVEESGAPENQSALLLCPYFLDYQRFQMSPGYRGRIPNTAEFDLVISILWSRLGALLDSSLVMPDGNSASSGTEYELAWALDHASQQQRRSAAACLSQRLTTDAAPGAKRGAGTLYSTVGLLTGVLFAFGKERPDTVGWDA